MGIKKPRKKIKPRRKIETRKIKGKIVGQMNGFPVMKVKASELRAAPYNPRKITEQAMVGLEASVSEFGMVQPIVWNKRSHRLVGGHQRIKTLDPDDYTDVVVVDLDDQKEKALNVALNNPHITGSWTSDLGEILEEIDDRIPQMAKDLRFGDLTKDYENLSFKNDREEPTAPEAEEPPKQPHSKSGKVYRLGPHRVMCGDATSPKDVARLLDSALPRLMVTDVPYGVNYDTEWRNREADKGTIARRAKQNSKRTGAVANDDIASWLEAYRLSPAIVVYVWHAALNGDVVKADLATVGFKTRTQIIWKKPVFAISRGHYHWQHECLWYAVKKNKTAKWCGPRNECTIWEIQNLTGYTSKRHDEDSVTDHATQKPLECMERPIRNHKGDVYDPFMGSGTTLIAAARQDRKCWGMEIDPAYVDVIRKRWGDYARANDLDPGRDAL